MFLFIFFAFPGARQAEGSPEQSLEPSILTEFKAQYGTNVVMGDPLEVEGYKIIPIVNIRVAENLSSTVHGSGHPVYTSGGIYPVGFIVISSQGIQILKVPPDLLGILLEKSLPFFRVYLEHVARGQKVSLKGRETMPVDELAWRTVFLVPEHLLGLGIYIWWAQKLLFASTWYILAFLAFLLFRDQIGKVALMLRTRPLISLFSGVMGLFFSLFFAFIMALSIIGLPLTFIILLFFMVTAFLGTVALGTMLGGLILKPEDKSVRPSANWILLGGLILAGARMIPHAGWILWIIFGSIGFGGILLTLTAGNTGKIDPEE